jgi:hypothetical protein
VSFSPLGAERAVAGNGPLCLRQAGHAPGKACHRAQAQAQSYLVQQQGLDEPVAAEAWQACLLGVFRALERSPAVGAEHQGDEPPATSVSGVKAFQLCSCAVMGASSKS